MLNVNAHLHTPYSFSAFRDINDALDRAAAENVKVVGINDFYTSKGFEEWKKGCDKRKLYPLFGIEFISLSQEEQNAGIRVNDPANPGRTYLSGKGMSYPFKIPEPYASELKALEIESDKQVEEMFYKLNDYLRELNAGFELNLKWIKDNLTLDSFRERHLARALRMKIYEFCRDDESVILKLFKTIFGGKELKSSLNDIAGVENEIRSILLKAGGAAYVPEERSAFLPVQSVCDIILAAGGIPTYPFLADNVNGEYTDFERDLEVAAQKLTERGIHSVEFITTRNDIKLLDKYAGYLYDKGFIVTFGSEHNSPVMEPVELFARNGVPLTDRLKRINFEGACVVAAHQHVVSQGLEGYIEDDGQADRNKRNEFIRLGEELINSVVKK
ncbi:MAG: PHP domain-containing protein [Fermentimonas sp.]|nr:PHP domain-containing protein [Fermentimonas sp.]